VAYYDFRSHQIRDLYRKSSLDHIYRQSLKLSHSSIGDVEYSEFQRDELEGLFGIRFDFLASSVINLDQDGMPTDLECTRINLPESIEDSYLRVAAHDDMAGTLYAYPGRIIRHTQLRSHEAWLEHTFYLDHCRIFDIERAMMVGFLYPGRDRKYIAFEYLGARDNLTWKHLDDHILELGTFPFALAWLYRKGAIDDVRLRRYLTALEDLTTSEIANLRIYINKPYDNLAQQAHQLGRRPDGWKKSLYRLRDKVADRFEWAREIDPVNARKQLRPLDVDYAFLRMLGDPTRPIISS